MQITYFSCFINHHQVWVADELYKLTNGNYRFVCVEELPTEFRKNGYADYFNREYVICAYTEEGYREAIRLAEESDVAIFGGNEDVQAFREVRMRKRKLSFECGERWLKRGYLNLLSPRLLKAQFRYHTRYKKIKDYYSLSISAYGARDYEKMCSFEGKCYKWAYFTEVEDIDLEGKTFSGKKMMWCNRFISWKHPELAIMMAKKMKDEGYVFQLDMYGGGAMLEGMKELVLKLGLNDVVKICGTASNDIIRDEMRNHDILLTTSDRNEGWGATVNEGMSNGCVVIGADEVGSVPRLIVDGYNGLVFKSNNLDSLCEKVKEVLCNPERCKEISANAYITMKDIWCPKNAAKQLMHLCECLLSGQKVDIVDGPCSLDL